MSAPVRQLRSVVLEIQSSECRALFGVAVARDLHELKVLEPPEDQQSSENDRLTCTVEVKLSARLVTSWWRSG